MAERCTAEEEQAMASTSELSSPSKATERNTAEEEQEMERNTAEEEQEMVLTSKLSSPSKETERNTTKGKQEMERNTAEEEQEMVLTSKLSSPSKETERNTAKGKQEMVLAGNFSSPTKNSDLSEKYTSSADSDDEAYQPSSETEDEQSTMQEEEEEEMEADTTVSEWKSKNGAITWSSTNERTLRYSPVKTTMHPGPTKYAICRIDTILSSFELLMTDKIIQLVVENTNIQGNRMSKDWKDVDAQEIRAFIGLLILAGVYRSRGENTLSLWDRETGRGIFRATIARKRFHHIGNMIRFDDKLTRPARRAGRSDKLAPIRTLWDMWESRLAKLFNPSQNVCVDEQLLAYRGRCPFKQYIPSKPSRYGIKIWVACDVPTSYAWRMQVYTGRSRDGPREVNQGQRVVLDMTKGLQGKTITCDNFFTSYSLGNELLKRKNTLVGTMRKCKPEVPQELLRVKHRKLLSSQFAFTENHTLVSYVPKRSRNVLLLSTKHREAAVSSEHHKKPQIILDYNRCKAGVDTMDKLITSYSCKRRTCRWPLVLFFNILDVSAINAYVLWTAIDPSWLKGTTYKRRKFLEELGKSLVAPLLCQEKLDLQVPGAQAFSDHTAPVSPGKRKMCNICRGSNKKGRKTTIICSKCNKPTCKEHSETVCKVCFSLV